MLWAGGHHTTLIIKGRQGIPTGRSAASLILRAAVDRDEKSSAWRTLHRQEVMDGLQTWVGLFPNVSLQVLPLAHSIIKGSKPDRKLCDLGQ